ncbi:MAG: deoxyribose-phosphate aldolase [Anaerolineaceae bacterium]|nr:deoxyribose-phosphate aldolase [Anaerolineaceae bacterium]
MAKLNPREFDQLVDQITQQVVSKLTTGGSPAGAPSSTCNCPDGRCVRDCSDRVKQVVANGAGRITSSLGYIPRDLSIARLIDHTLLKPDTSAGEIRQLCQEAREYHFASVCINSAYVPLCADLLKGSDVAVCTVVGFPLGASPAEVKAYEAQLAIQNGATEIDMVLNIGTLKSNDLKGLYHDISTVVKTCHAHNVICKVILETSKLTDEEKVAACQVCKMAGADFVKTSTGFGGGGATVNDVALMRKVVGPNIGVKASGGVRNFQDAQAMVKAGATRIGASAGVMIAKAERGETVDGGGKGY